MSWLMWLVSQFSRSGVKVYRRPRWEPENTSGYTMARLGSPPLPLEDEPEVSERYTRMLEDPSHVVSVLIPGSDDSHEQEADNARS